MRYIFLLTAIIVASCSHHEDQPHQGKQLASCGTDSEACQHSSQGISGTIEFDPSITGTRETFGCRASHFDAKETISRADQAFAQGRYDEAFGGYLAACDLEHPHACDHALEILDTGLLQPAPSESAQRGLREALKINPQRTPVLGLCEESES